MKTNVFLKIDRMDMHAVHCLRFWLETFKDYPTWILCDRTEEDGSRPTILDTCFLDYPQTKFTASDRSLVTYLSELKPRKRNMATANLTGFELSKSNSDNFWMIDADDTQFLTHRWDALNDKLHSAEQYLVEHSLDGFSLDFYSTHNAGWTFGVALFRSDLHWTELTQIKGDEMRDFMFPRNIDAAFHCMREKKLWKLESFVFSGMSFQHVYNNYPEMVNGVYYWNKGMLWDIPLPNRIVSL